VNYNTTFSLNTLKPRYTKLLLYSTLLVFITACFITACTKKDFKQISTITPGGSDSTAMLDSLPSFNNPTGVAIDASGNLYVADYGNNLIREITPAGVVSTFAGSGNVGTLDATGLLASFNEPAGITIDAYGNLFVSDAGSDLIRKISPAGVVVTIAGSDSTGFVNGMGLTSTFFTPLGLTVDANDNVYVADAGNNMIRKITSAGMVSTFAGVSDTTTFTTAPPSLIVNPTGVVIDGAGNVYVANYLANNILLINPAGTVSILAGSNTGTPGSANGPVGSATFYLPNSIALDAQHNLYISDGVNNLIRKITPGGLVSTFAGSGAAGALDSVGTAASFNGPAGLAVDPSGNVYVADSNNDLIRKITPAGVVSTIAGNGLAGAKNGIAVAHRNRRIIHNAPRSIFSILFKQKPR
jgi:sugar lactone lactonase YvrE